MGVLGVGLRCRPRACQSVRTLFRVRSHWCSFALGPVFGLAMIPIIRAVRLQSAEGDGIAIVGLSNACGACRQRTTVIDLQDNFNVCAKIE